MPAKKMTFEASMERLGEIVARLEAGSDSLEESIKLFEEGTALGPLLRDAQACGAEDSRAVPGRGG